LSLPLHYPLTIFFRYALDMRAPLWATLFPYTTLFRSSGRTAPLAAQAPSASKRRPRCCRIQPSSRVLAGPTSKPRVASPASTVIDRKSTRLLQSRENLVCRLLLEKKNVTKIMQQYHQV